MIELDVSNLKRTEGEIHKLSLKVILPPLGSGLEEVAFLRPLELDLNITSLSQNLFVQGQLKTVLRICCGRCLDPFEFPLEVPFAETYYNEAILEDEPEEEWIAYRGDRLNLGPEVEIAILAALPMRPLCQEDCPGLCPVCGNNRKNQPCQCAEKELDPRLAVLKNLF